MATEKEDRPAANPGHCELAGGAPPGAHRQLAARCLSREATLHVDSAGLQQSQQFGLDRGAQLPGVAAEPPTRLVDRRVAHVQDQRIPALRGGLHRLHAQLPNGPGYPCRPAAAAARVQPRHSQVQALPQRLQPPRVSQQSFHQVDYTHVHLSLPVYADHSFLYRLCLDHERVDTDLKVLGPLLGKLS